MSNLQTRPQSPTGPLVRTGSSRIDLEKVWEERKPARRLQSKSLGGLGNDVVDAEKITEEASPSRQDPSQFPDGGQEAWLVTLGCWCVFFVSWGPINTIGIFQEYYQQEVLKDYSPSAIEWISSTKLFVMYAGGIIVGWLFDSYGPRWLLLIGSAMHVYGFMMTSFSTKYYQIFLSQAICSAVGTGCIYYASAGSITTWFLKKRSTAFGIAATGSSAGAVVLPIIVSRLIPKVGFPWTMRIIGFVILALVVVINLTVRSRIQHTPKPFRIGAYIAPYKEPSFSFLALSMTLLVFGVYLPFDFIVLQAQSEGMSRTMSENLVPILNASSIPGRIIPGLLADRLGNFNVMFIFVMALGIVTLGVWVPGGSTGSIIIFTVLYGVFSGAYLALAPMLVAQISKIQQIGIRSGAMFFAVSTAALAGGPVGGALVDADNGRFRYVQIFTGAMFFASAGAVLMARACALGFSVKKF
ncbi:MAG: hypothetical protein Q9170_004744 [Blastenia crenularia]